MNLLRGNISHSNLLVFDVQNEMTIFELIFGKTIGNRNSKRMKSCPFVCVFLCFEVSFELILGGTIGNGGRVKILPICVSGLHETNPRTL